MGNKKEKKSLLDRFLKNIILLSIIISFIVFGIIWIFTNTFYDLDRSIGEKIYTQFAKTNFRVSKNIALVGIDEKTTEKLGRFPFGREHYIPVIKNLKKAGAIVVGFDVIFADKSNKIIDKNFAKAIKEAENIVLGGAVINGKNKDLKFEYPLAIINKEILTTGYVEPVIDKKNGRVYSIRPEAKINGKIISHFAISLLRAYKYKYTGEKKYLNFKNNYKKGDNFFYITPKNIDKKKELKVPYDNRGNRNIGINFISDYKMPFESFIDVKNNKFSPDKFKDKIVIVGATAKGIKDLFFAPNGKAKFGVYTHANIVNTILNQKFRIYFSHKLELVLIFFLILLSVYVNLSLTGKGLLIGNISIISIFLVIIMFIIIKLNFILNYTSEYIFALIITLTVSNILKSFMEDKNKKLLHSALSDYVAPEIAEEILHGKGKINLDGEKKKISIFFSDIEGFTTISEKMIPKELVAFLREYLGKMTNIILLNKGFVNKYEGDAIMALWGSFSYENSSTYDACISAIGQQKKLKELNVIWKEKFGEELKIRMGINTGDAIVGNIGVKGGKMEYTALGDSVNLASRLEEVNKKYGTYLCVSETVYLDQKDNFEFRYLDRIRVKGKTIPVKIYELISMKGEIDKFKQEIINKFENAIKLYLAKDFKLALNIFRELVKIGDNPSKTYIIRVEGYLKNPPEKNWDGVWTMKTK